MHNLPPVSRRLSPVGQLAAGRRLRGLIGRALTGGRWELNQIFVSCLLEDEVPSRDVSER